MTSEITTAATVAPAPIATYRVHVEVLPALYKEIEKLNRRHARYGTPAVQVTELGEETVTDDYGYVDVLRVLALTGEAPRVAGWQFVATLDHTDEGTILRTVPGETAEGEVARYREAGPACDHCRVSRFRRDTFVVRETATGALRQVGRQCLADYLGGQSPQAIAYRFDYFALLEALLTQAERGDGYRSGDGRYIDLGTYLTYVASAIRQDGWLSRGAAREQERYGQATADLASRAMEQDRTCHERPCFERKHFHLTLIDADAAEADTVITWVRGLQERAEAEGRELSDYEWNLYVVCKASYISPRSEGLAASAVAVYQRSIGKERERARVAATSQHIGTEGQRAVFVGLTVNSATNYESDFGVKTLYRMTDASGNVVIWWSSGSVSLDEDRTYDLKATVKRHGEYKGIAQTELQRCQIVKEWPVAEAEATTATEALATC